MSTDRLGKCSVPQFADVDTNGMRECKYTGTTGLNRKANSGHQELWWTFKKINLWHSVLPGSPSLDFNNENVLCDVSCGRIMMVILCDFIIKPAFVRILSLGLYFGKIQPGKPGIFLRRCGLRYLCPVDQNLKYNIRIPHNQAKWSIQMLLSGGLAGIQGSPDTEETGEGSKIWKNSRVEVQGQSCTGEASVGESEGQSSD